MKRLLICAAAVASVAAVLFGCSSKTDPLPMLDIALADGAGTSMNFSEAGGEASVRITCNGAWRIDCEASWITFSLREGSGDAEVRVSVGPTESARSAVVTVRMPEFLQMRRSFDTVQRVTADPEDPEIPVGPSDPEIRRMTIAELNAAMPASESSAVADEGRDIRFEGVVQNDAGVGNYPPRTLFVADADAADAGDGICLVGDAVDLRECGVTCGDRVAVTLRAGRAMLVNRGGMRCVTGDGEWVTVERTGESGNVAAIAVDPSRSADYCGMTVTLCGARPAAGGVWCSTADAVHEFSASGTAFDVGICAAARDFVGREFFVREGSVTGIVMVRDGRVVIYPRSPADVADFATKPDDGDEPDTPPASDGMSVTTLAQLSAGRYYLGGYQDGVLHLASGAITSAGHGDTVVYDTDADGTVSPVGEAAAEVTLEAADEPNGYYIRFADGGYLTAVAAGAGKLRLSPERGAYWIFSECEGGFDVRQAGDIAVKIIISERASTALLRSVAADEDGNPIVLFRVAKDN